MPFIYLSLFKNSNLSIEPSFSLRICKPILSFAIGPYTISYCSTSHPYLFANTKSAHSSEYPSKIFIRKFGFCIATISNLNFVTIGSPPNNIDLKLAISIAWDSFLLRQIESFTKILIRSKLFQINYINLNI